MQDYAESQHPRPVLSLIIAGIDNYSTVFEALRASEEQTIIDRLELLVIIPSLRDFAAPDDFFVRHPRVRLIETGHALLLNQARYIGICQARSDYVFLLEDHCLPTRDCMERIFQRLSEGTWSVVGPSVVCGNTWSAYGKASNLLTYGEWMGYNQAKERRYVTGYSSAWRREALLALGSALENELTIPSHLQERLSSAGEHFFFEPEAVMLHWEASSPKDNCRILFNQGRGMGYIRRGTSGTRDKIIATLKFPLLTGYRTLRGIRAWQRTRTRSLKVLAIIPFFSMVWCCGELSGYWTRDGAKAIAGVSNVERMRQPFIDAVREPLHRPWAEAGDCVPFTATCYADAPL